METKETGRYLLFALILFGIILLAGSIEIQLKQIMSETYKLYPYIIFRCLIYIPVGVALGLPTIFEERKNVGNWNFKYIKFTLLGLPALYFTLYYVIHFNIGFLRFPTNLVPEMPSNVIGGIIFGYVIITSFYKVQKKSFQTNGGISATTGTVKVMVVPVIFIQLLYEFS